MPAQLLDVLWPELVPVLRAVDGQRLIRCAEHVVRVDLKIPVDPAGGVPLLVFALLVQGEQPGPAFVVLPAEPRVAVGRHVSIFRIDANSGARLELLTAATVSEGGWVDLAEPIVMRAGDAFIAVPQ